MKKRKKITDAEKKLIDLDDDGKDDKVNLDKPDMNFVTSKFGETAYDILYNYIQDNENTEIINTIMQLKNAINSKLESNKPDYPKVYHFTHDELKRKFDMYVPKFTYNKPVAENENLKKVNIHSTPEEILKAKPDVEKGNNLAKCKDLLTGDIMSFWKKEKRI